MSIAAVRFWAGVRLMRLAMRVLGAPDPSALDPDVFAADDDEDDGEQVHPPVSLSPHARRMIELGKASRAPEPPPEEKPLEGSIEARVRALRSNR